MADLDKRQSVRAAALTSVLSIAVVTILSTMPALGDELDACGNAPATHTAAPERILRIDTDDGLIAATLATPAGKAPDALALMLHEYTGARNEIPVAGGEGMFARTARAFAERGIASLRIDFIGSGQSDGSWADTRFSGQARDAMRAARWLKAEFADGDVALGVLGYSQGGLVALRAAAVDGLFDKVALWNPVMDPMATYGIIFGLENIDEGARQARQDQPGGTVGETRLRPGFFAELVEVDPITDSGRVDAPLLIVTGRRDPLVADGAALAQRAAQARAGETIILDLDAGHDLGAIKNPALLDEVIRCTAKFILESTIM
ncbi:MAG: alpha/beta fold hydrolase [Pseudomonadota bacterium]